VSNEEDVGVEGARQAREKKGFVVARSSGRITSILDTGCTKLRGLLGLVFGSPAHLHQWLLKRVDPRVALTLNLTIPGEKGGHSKDHAKF